MNRSQRMRVAQSTLGRVDDLLSRGGTDIYSLQELAGITEATKGSNIGQAGRLYLEKAGLSELAAMKTLVTANKDSGAYRKAAESMRMAGLGDLVGDEDLTRKILSVKGKTVAGRVMGLVGNDIDEDARKRIMDVFSGQTDVKSFKEFEAYVGKGVDLNDFLSRMRTEGLDPRATLGIFSGDDVPKTKPVETTSSVRKQVQERIAVKSKREMLEAKIGKDYALKMTGFGEGVEYERWEQQQVEKDEEGLLLYTKEARKDKLKERFHSEKAMPMITDFMNRAVKAGTEKTQEQREDEAGKQVAPGNLVDASKDMTAASKSFLTSVESFSKAVNRMEGLSGRPSGPQTSFAGGTGPMLTQRDVKKMALGRNY